jgi:phosphoribosyl 1,2-cyclic phosphate phosphodiesterase
VKVTFLGTGTSQGVPFIGCDCDVCTSADKRDQRLRSSVWVETPEVSFVIDSGPDFRYQMLRANVRKLDAIVFTHGHKDHVAGLDDIRPYNYFQKRDMQIYATLETQQVLRREFSYIFENAKYPGIPQININTITAQDVFHINGLAITPIRLLHYKLEVLGFRIGNFVYITDASYISDEEIAKMQGCQAITLNALRHEPHISHFTYAQAIELANRIGAPVTYFTHISHQLGLHQELEAALPPHIRLAYDGLELNCKL